MLSKTLREKKKGRRHNAKHTKTTNQPPKDLHTLSLYRGRKNDGTKREVHMSRHAYHALLLHVYRTSSIAFLLHADLRREPTKV